MNAGSLDVFLATMAHAAVNLKTAKIGEAEFSSPELLLVLAEITKLRKDKAHLDAALSRLINDII